MSTMSDRALEIESKLWDDDMAPLHESNCKDKVESLCDCAYGLARELASEIRSVLRIRTSKLSNIKRLVQTFNKSLEEHYDDNG